MSVGETEQGLTMDVTIWNMKRKTRNYRKEVLGIEAAIPKIC
jgi:hypothetical protein